MNVLKRRTRMISFRLSEEEYEGLKRICVRLGARSLSDIARDAVQQLLNNGAELKNDGSAQLRVLYERIDALDREVKRLAGLVDNRNTATVTAAADSANSH